MQGRGTAHWHAAVHVKDAPRVDLQPDDEVVAFIDNAVTCTIPDEQKDPLLHNLVRSRQLHHHTKTCKKKKGVSCRFHYPRPPSNRTMITRPQIEQPDQDKLQTAKKILTKVLDAIHSPHTGTLEELLASVGVDVNDYEEALQISGAKIGQTDRENKVVCLKVSDFIFSVFPIMVEDSG